jgi:hypothetical protein
MKNNCGNKYGNYKRKILTDDCLTEKTSADSQKWLDDYTSRINLL